MAQPLTRRSLLAAAPLLAASAQTPASLLIVASKGNNEAAIADAGTLQVLTRITVGDGPHEVALSPDRRLAYVSNYALVKPGAGLVKPGNSISVIDLAQRKEIERIDLGVFLMPHGMVAHGPHLYFTAEAQRLLARYNVEQKRIDWAMGTGLNGGHMVVLAPDGSRAWVANIPENQVTAIDIGKVPGPTKVKHIAVGKGPEGIGITPRGNEVWVAHRGDGKLSVIDTASDSVAAVLDAGKLPYRVAFTPDGRRALVADPVAGHLVVFDAAKREILRRIDTGQGVAQGVIAHSDNRRAFVAGGSTVKAIDLDQGQVIGSMEVGPGADGIAVT
ncbi:MAG: YncE family protein [Bryobacteraceae bacterium]|nr:YncE family protein [Bryobacteraceae bacterium]